MSNPSLRDSDLLAYLDEMLPTEQMAHVERQLRESESLRNRAAGLVRHRDQGAHAVGEIWRRLRLSCPERSQLGSYLLGTLDENALQYVEFHIQTVGCRYCSANLDDLRNEQATNSGDKTTRRSRYFQSSAGYLKKPGGK